MQVLQIGVIQPQAMALLRELDSLKLITIIEPEVRSEAPSEKRPVFGCAESQFWMSDDFDAPLEDFAE
ncbi:MAG: DUF2281 domain-containing protein [Planctomycetaceae bacterium]|nr:DUF2281 domain-containing protein [Planctomycetaceae bacterium]